MAEPNSKTQILHGFWTRYSTWTARVVLLLEYYKIPYEGSYYNIYDPASRPSGEHFKGRLYPMLQPDPNDQSFIIEDSLAICEYLAETFPDRDLWPRDAKLRALARVAAAQMHSGFTEIRNTYHGNFTAKYTGKIPVSDTAAQEIRKVIGVWNNARAQTTKRLQELGETSNDDGFLFGKFSIADAFFWPVLWRFRSYQLPLDGISPAGLEWMATMWNDPVVKAEQLDYFKQAEDGLYLDKYDDIYKGNPEIRFGQFDASWKFSA